jgi:hypothetical protein
MTFKTVNVVSYQRNMKKVRNIMKARHMKRSRTEDIDKKKQKQNKKQLEYGISEKNRNRRKSGRR